MVRGVEFLCKFARIVHTSLFPFSTMRAIACIDIVTLILKWLKIWLADQQKDVAFRALYPHEYMNPLSPFCNSNMLCTVWYISKSTYQLLNTAACRKIKEISKFIIKILPHLFHVRCLSLHLGGRGSEVGSIPGLLCCTTTTCEGTMVRSPWWHEFDFIHHRG